MTEPAASAQATFVTTQIDAEGQRGGWLGGKGKPRVIAGELRTPHAGLVLWRVIERVEVEKQLLERRIVPSEDGQSVSYSYTLQGGDGGLFPIDEPGQFRAELVAAFVPPAFLPEVGQVEIISTARDPDAERGTKAAVNKRQVASAAQLEGRLIRLPGEGQRTVWYVENGVKRRLASPTAGALRFGDSWSRLIQVLATDEDASIVPDGSPLTLAEAGEGRILGAWPAPEIYLVQDGRKRRIDDPAPLASRFGEHWRVNIHHLRRDELDAIPDGEPI